MSADPSLASVPPESDLAELRLVAVALAQPFMFAPVAGTVAPSHFRSERLGAVWAVLVSLHSKGERWSPETVHRQAQLMGVVQRIARPEGVLSADGLPGPALDAIRQLDADGHHGFDAAADAALVVDAALRRDAVHGAAHGVTLARDGSASVSDLVAHHRRLADRLEAGVVVEATGSAAELVGAAFKDLSEPRTEAEGSLSWGLPSLDRLGVRIDPGSYPILAAATGGGKSTLATQAAFGVAERTGRPVLYVSLEMPPAEIVKRAIVARSGYPAPTYGHPSSESVAAWASAREELRGVPVYLPEVRERSLVGFLRWLSAVCRKLEPAVAFIDHIGLIRTGASSIYQETTQVSQALRAFALGGDLVPIVGLAQLRRGERSKTGETRPPELSDLKDSGSIENDATSVLMLDSPWLRVSTDARSAGGVSETEAALYLKKNRHGSTHRKVPLYFDGARYRITEAVREPYGNGCAHEADPTDDNIAQAARANPGTSLPGLARLLAVPASRIEAAIKSGCLRAEGANGTTRLHAAKEEA